MNDGGELDNNALSNVCISLSYLFFSSYSSYSKIYHRCYTGCHISKVINFDLRWWTGTSLKSIIYYRFRNVYIPLFENLLKDTTCYLSLGITKYECVLEFCTISKYVLSQNKLLLQIYIYISCWIIYILLDLLDYWIGHLLKMISM